MSKENISAVINNCVAWSAEEFATRFPEVNAKFLSTKRCRFITLLTRLSDDFGILLFDGETVKTEAGCLRNRSIINDKKQRNSFAR